MQAMKDWADSEYIGCSSCINWSLEMNKKSMIL